MIVAPSPGGHLVGGPDARAQPRLRRGHTNRELKDGPMAAARNPSRSRRTLQDRCSSSFAHPSLPAGQSPVSRWMVGHGRWNGRLATAGRGPKTSDLGEGGGGGPPSGRGGLSRPAPVALMRCFADNALGESRTCPRSRIRGKGGGIRAGAGRGARVRVVTIGQGPSRCLRPFTAAGQPGARSRLLQTSRPWDHRDIAHGTREAIMGLA